MFDRSFEFVSGCLLLYFGMSSWRVERVEALHALSLFLSLSTTDFHCSLYSSSLHHLSPPGTCLFVLGILDSYHLDHEQFEPAFRPFVKH